MIIQIWPTTYNPLLLSQIFERIQINFVFQLNCSDNQLICFFSQQFQTILHLHKQGIKSGSIKWIHIQHIYQSEQHHNIDVTWNIE